MRIAVIIGLVLVLMAGPASAENNKGITPDSILWQGELLMEQIHEGLTFDTDKKVELKLQHAEERLREMQVSSNGEAALEQYVKTMNNLQNMGQVSYQSSQMIQARVQNQTQILEQYSANEQASNALQTAKQTQTTVKQKSSAIVNENLQWWVDLRDQYAITYHEVSALELAGVSYDSVEKYVPAGTTQFYITQEDGTAVDEYIVEKTDSDITIKKGISTSPDQEYILTLEQIRNYKDYYEGVL